MKDPRDIIIRPIISERSMDDSSEYNKYTFRVAKTANKIEIKQAVEATYNVTVTDVNTLIVTPKKKNRFTRSGVINGKTSAYKKAIITVKDGETIDFYSNI